MKARASLEPDRAADSRRGGVRTWRGTARATRASSTARTGSRPMLLQFVPTEDPIKISRLTLQNDSGRTRRLSVTAYAEWVLGSSRSSDRAAPHHRVRRANARHVRAERLERRVRRAHRLCRSRREAELRAPATAREFLGRNGSAATRGARSEAARFPGSWAPGSIRAPRCRPSSSCARAHAPKIVFLLGQGEQREQARELTRALSRRGSGPGLDRGHRPMGRHSRAPCKSTTPDPAMDLLLNRWLLYQTLSCRVWARAGVLPVERRVWIPRSAAGRDGARGRAAATSRASIFLRAAARQFVEGDVQHWWHPPSGRGIRTRISDDLLWLPYAVSPLHRDDRRHGRARRIRSVSRGRRACRRAERIVLPAARLRHARVALRALRASARSQPRGRTPWPAADGHGRLERRHESRRASRARARACGSAGSCTRPLRSSRKIADARGEHQRAETWRLHVSALKAALEREGWDGEWYRRAYFRRRHAARLRRKSRSAASIPSRSPGA